ncbi:MAG: phenylalanine--tRNA ligase subunit alpha [candidate division WOR-3 bacterium]
MQLEDLTKEAKQKLQKATTIEEVESIRIRFLGRKGLLTKILRSIGELPEEERPKIGKIANEIKTELLDLIEKKKEELIEKKTFPWIDLSLPGRKPEIGGLHPITILCEEIQNVFIKMGFSVVSGPEIETEYYNFTALNTPKDHPARDMHDTFYLKDGRLLRTHTSPVQIRALERYSPPLRIISPGRCYRVDTFDPLHSPAFTQIEGLWVDKNISMADLFGTLDLFAKEIFGKDVKTKFLPSYFPFTEPSAEMWIECPFCKGKGCSVCKTKGRIEIAGAGMVHPNILNSLGYEGFNGFAFGMGVDRLAMTKYNINDIRLFSQNELQFLRQFDDSKL